MSVAAITYHGKPILALEPERIRCPFCQGRGWQVHQVNEDDGSVWDATHNCYNCRGNGWLWHDGTAGPGKKRAAQS